MRCRIETSGEWARWTNGGLGRKVHAALRHTIDPWIDALQLPVNLRFQWFADRASDWPGETVCRLLFDDRDSVFVRLPAEASADPETVAARIAAGVFEARTSLVTSSVARFLRREFHPAGAGKSDRLLLARELIRRGLRPQRAWDSTFALPADAPESHYDFVVDHGVIALRVELARVPQRPQPGDEKTLDPLLEMMTDGLFYESGLMLPPIEVDVDESLAPTAIRIWVNDLPLPLQAGLAAGEVLVGETPDQLSLLGLPEGRAAVNPANGNAASIIAASDANLKTVKEQGLMIWGPAGYLVLALSAVVRRFAGAFWTVDSTDAALFLLRDAFEPLIEAVELRFDRELLTKVLRTLLDEEVSVRNLSAILESMLAIDSVSNLDDSTLVVFAPTAGHMVVSHRARSVAELQLEDWVNCVRIRLAPYLSHKYTRGQSSLIAYLLDPSIEAEIEAASRASPAPAAPVHPLHSPDGYLRLFRAIDEEIRALPAHGARPVILTTQSIRHKLRELISKDFPDLAVLCYQELSPEMNIQPIARITWPLTPADDK